jgi:ribonuclease III
MNSRDAAIADLERNIGHSFADRELLERALTHASVGDRNPKIQTNERLEFLGDRVLNLIIADELMRRAPDAPEGDLTKAFHKLINVESCAEVGDQLGLGEALRFGGGAGKLGMRRNMRVIGDACEALIAALYRDAGFDFTRACVLRLWTDQFAKLGAPERRDAKSLLNEWALREAGQAPEYRILSQEGPAHEPVFRVEVFVPGVEPFAAEAGSKREAEKLAAEGLLNRLGHAS